MSTSVEQSKAQDLHSENTSIIVDADAEKKLVRKIDLYLMPSVFILYLFSYMVHQSSNLQLYSAKNARTDQTLA
jgi:hypothetical protein